MNKSIGKALKPSWARIYSNRFPHLSRELPPRATSLELKAPIINLYTIIVKLC